ncbi:hypothetical protein VB735_17985 [Halotia wernerae UHCC 0503]|nr:hypothetical protein [Halotia wernerae UHCC 0503]
MVEQATLQSNQVPAFEDAKFELENCDIQNHNLIKASALWVKFEEIVDNAEFVRPGCICLNVEDLKCFESVDRQYEHWGVIFHNTLAIQPSNPAFPTLSGLTVLMSSSNDGFLEANFLQPVNCVSAFITSSQRLVLSAYDRDRQLLAQTILPGANLANSDSTVPPNTLLSIKAHDIYSVSFCAFDGQFTLDNFRFCV